MVTLPAGGARCAGFGTVMTAIVTGGARAVTLTLTLHRADSAGRAWPRLAAVRPDLPRSLPAPRCAATPHAGPPPLCLAALWAAGG